MDIRNTVAIAATLGLVLSAHAIASGWTMIDDGTGTHQVCSDGTNTYILKDNGNIFKRGWGRWDMVDNGNGTRMIGADGGNLYNLKNNGNIFKYSWSGWQQ